MVFFFLIKEDSIPHIQSKDSKITMNKQIKL